MATKREDRRQMAMEWVIILLAAAASAILVRLFVFGIIVVEGPSMQPTLYTNERLAVEKVSRYFRLPYRGEIIIVKYPGQEDTYVKRVVGLPGETVEVRGSVVYIDDRPLHEDYLSGEAYADMEPVIVPKDHVFVMGDNRAVSWDSRFSATGPIARDEILGHAFYVLYPFENARSIN